MRIKRFDASRVLSMAAGVALTFWLPACGGGSDPVVRSTPVPTPTPPPPPSVVSTGQGSLSTGFVGRATPFTTALTGNLDATVDWTFATNDVDVFIARGDCLPEPFVNGQCNIAAFSVSDTAKPERVQLAAAPPGVYTLLIGNSGPRDESLAWQVVLTPTAATASAAGAERSLERPDKARSYLGAASF